MTKPTDFAYRMSQYLTTYLPGVRGLRANTVLSYRDMFKLLIEFFDVQRATLPDNIRLRDLTRPAIEHYLEWLEVERHCSVTTRNVRLAAIHAFAQYLQREQPELMHEAQQLRAIPFKKASSGRMEYLTVEQMKLLLNLPNLAAPSGRRDAVLLSLLYDTGARVQELCDIVVGDLQLSTVSTVRLTGKGQKSRIVPLMSPMVQLLQQYRQEHEWTHPKTQAYPLFQNRAGGKLSREGVAYIVRKYVHHANRLSPGTLPTTVSPHCFRHYGESR